ncbi:unnamed protein product [Peronospora destructor]|uniref:Uncharacterized protein n=1 Tax=Peronospora destructor TaxID=86335 RepID=A0AAV0VGL4_9STRA|nr:unnamed protein product [Peronospora destructor]
MVFRFKHKAPSYRQEKILCETLVNQFAAFAARLNAIQESNRCCGWVDPLVDDRIVPAGVFTVHEVDVLRDICRRLKARRDDIHNRGDIWYDPWLPAYGCALLRTKINAAVIKLHVIYVDGWDRTLHFLPTGTKGSKRSAAVNNLGHQKTPQFIAAVVRRAIAAVMGRAVAKTPDEEDVDNQRFSPQGGITDVGQHTGGGPRDTCWPIVQAVIADNLCCNQRLFQKTMVMYQLSLLHAAVLETQSSFDRGICTRDGCDAVDDLFFMLQVVIEITVDLLDCGYNISALLDQYSSLRAKIDEFVDSLNRKIAICYQLPDHANMQRLNTVDGGIQAGSPKREIVSDPKMSDEECHLRALTNLEGCWYLDGVTCSLHALLCWEKSSGA